MFSASGASRDAFSLGAKEPASGQAPAVHACACLREAFQMPLTFQLSKSTGVPPW